MSWVHECASTPGSSGQHPTPLPSAARRSHCKTQILPLGIPRRDTWLIAGAWRTSHTENIKRQFNRLGRHNSALSISRSMPAPPNGAASESTPLISRETDTSGPRTWRETPKHVAAVTWATLASNYVNVFLIFVPIGIIAGALGWNPTAVFVLNFVAIIPLASLLSFATEELSAKLGQTLGGLLNATFGNAVELIVRPSTAAIWKPVMQNLIIDHRSLSLRSGRAKFASYSPACWVPFCRTSSW